MEGSKNMIELLLDVKADVHEEGYADNIASENDKQKMVTLLKSVNKIV